MKLAVRPLVETDLAAASVELVVIRIVWPSGAARAASAVPMTPIAPGRFSITNGWPSESCSCGPITRAIWSGRLPGGNGTTNLTGWPG